MLDNDQKKDRPDLGAAFIATNKKSPQSYDMSGTIVVDGVKHKFGAYKQKASGKGKMPEGTEFFTFYRVERADADGATASGSITVTVTGVYKIINGHVIQPAGDLLFADFA